MAALGSQSIATSYEQLLHVDTDGGGNTTTLVPVKDGDNGTTFSLELATTSIAIGATHKLFLDGGGDTFIHEPAANKIGFKTSDSTRMIIDDNSRISLSNNDSSGAVGTTLFGYLAGANIVSGAINNTYIGHGVGDATHTNAADDNVGVGYNALTALTTANGNVAVGSKAGLAISTGTYNTVIGFGALDEGSTQVSNNVAIGKGTMGGSIGTEAVIDCVAVGYTALGGALEEESSGTVAIGKSALTALTSGANNVAVGFESGKVLTTGVQNTLLGYRSGFDLNEGGRNTAVGYLAFGGTLDANGDESFDNTLIGSGAGSGDWVSAVSNKNTAVGSQSMIGAMNGALGNTSVGYSTLTELTEGDGNTAIGLRSMDSVTTGNYNTAIGQDSLAGCQGGATNVALGTTALYGVTSGDNNIGIGLDAGRTGSPGGNQTTGDNKIFFGDENITESNIQVDWTVASDKRDKTDVNDLDLGLEFLNKLSPITYKWDKRAKYIDKNDEDADLDNATPDGTHKEDWLDIGFLAQDVEAIEAEYGYKIADKTNLTTSCTGDGKQYGIQYSKFVPMLVKAVQELSAQVEELKEQLENK